MGDFSVVHAGERGKRVIQPDFNRSIKLDFQSATLTPDTGFLLLREVDERFKIISCVEKWLEDPRSPSHTKHFLVQLIRDTSGTHELDHLASELRCLRWSCLRHSEHLLLKA